MSFNTTEQSKPTGTFTTWGAVKRCPESGRIILLNPKQHRHFDVADDPNFECPGDGDVRNIEYERYNTPGGQATRLLRIQTRVDDPNTFTDILN